MSYGLLIESAAAGAPLAVPRAAAGPPGGEPNARNEPHVNNNGETTMTKRTLPQLPAMPSATRARRLRGCACGCGGTTQGTFVPGHDSKLKAYVMRIEAAIMKLEDFDDWPGIKAQVERVVAMRAKGQNPTFMRNVELPEQPEQEQAEEGTGTEG